MRLCIPICVPLVCLCLASCERYKYQLDLTPHGAELERALVVESAQKPGNVIPEEAARLARLYSAELKRDTVAKLSFTATFQAVMPADVGGAGTHTTFPTSLGTLHIYSERFRGEPDLLAQWHRQEAAIDLLVDLSIAWSEETLRGEDGLAQLREFLNTPLRRDLRNAALYLRWSGVLESAKGATDQERSAAGRQGLIWVAGPLAQYLIERGYAEPKDIPALFQLTALEEDDTIDATMRFFQRLLIARMGQPDQSPVPKPLSALNTPRAWRESIDKFLKSERSKQLLTAWNDRRKPRLPLTDTIDQLAIKALTDAIGASIVPNFDTIKLSLHLTQEPFATNGRWDDAAKVVTWNDSIVVDPAEATGLPTAALALWCDVDKAEQTRRFGSVKLDGEALASYCLHRAALSEAQAAQWDAFLASLAAGPDLPRKVQAFRFKGHENDKQPPPIARSFPDSPPASPLSE